jgi:hypothetical protein
MLTVAPDRDLVERLLRNGGLVCPRCETGVLGGHGWVPRRWLRRADGLVMLLKAHATEQEIAGGKAAGGLRRGRCKDAECRATHVLVPPGMLARRLDEAEVIGAALLARAGGAGCRRISARAGRPVSTVRGWLRRLEQNAPALRAAFTGLVHRLDASPPVLTAGRGEAAEAVAAMGEAAAAVRRLLGTSMRALSPWQVTAAVSHGGLLAVAAPARLFHTSRHLVITM